MLEGLENYDRVIQLIESVFRQAHADAHRGDDDAASFLALYGVQPQAQGHRVLATNKRPRRRGERDKMIENATELIYRSGAAVKV